MKKNTMMRFASLVLVLTLLSTCAISGTFAKYTSTGSATDTAHVAKWGVKIEGTTADTNNMFVKTYNETGAMTVQSTTDVVAPGTSGTFSQFAVTGTPEVSTKITYDATVTLTGDWTSNGTDFYCPIVISVNEAAVDTSKATSAEEYQNAVKAAIDAVTATYAPNTDLATYNNDISITWAWAFDGEDAKDTYLGNLEELPQITVKVDVTIDQVD